jgi:hypothetical protein
VSAPLQSFILFQGQRCMDQRGLHRSHTETKQSETNHERSEKRQKTEAGWVRADQREEQKSEQVTFLALGTWGDVLPMALLASAFATVRASLGVRVVTHTCFRPRLGESAIGEGPFAHLTRAANLSYHFLDIPILFSPAADGTAPTAVRNELNEIAGACANTSVGVVFSLYSLAGYHVAEHLGVPCVAVSPTIAPPSAATGHLRLAKRLARAMPVLFGRLQTAADGRTSRLDVDHWMAPLFSAAYAPWRKHDLALPSRPLLQWNNARCPAPLPPPVPLLYGLSPLVVPRPGYWPAAARLCGPWFWNAPPPTRPEPSSLQVVFVGFGSMATLAAAAETDGGSRRAAVLEWVASELRAFSKARGCRVRGLVQGFSDILQRAPLCVRAQRGGEGIDSLLLRGGEADKAGEAELVLLSEGYLDHDRVFASVDAAVHHGGAGSTHAALRAGCPQVVCPVAFDQFFWGEQIKWVRGVCGSPLTHATCSSG